MFSAIRTTLTPKSIRAQLTLWYLLMLGGALAAFGVFVFISRQHTLYREADVDLQLRTQQLIDELQPTLLALDLPAALGEDRRLAETPVAVRAPSGLLIYRSPAFPALPWTADAAAIEAARSNDALTTVEDRDGNSWRLATAIVGRTGATPLVVQAAASSAPVQQALRQLLLAMLIWFLFVVSVASYGGRFIARRALRPVDAIVARVRAIQATHMDARLDVRAGSEELDRLVETLNNLLDRLETSMHGARRFAADASHELQTPIAAMRAALDMCLAGDRMTATGFRVVAAELVDDLDSLSRLVRDLRLLALADAGHLLDRVEPVDVAAIVRDCCDILVAVAEPKNIAVSVEILDEVAVCGSALHLRRALLNLAQNAVAYSPAGSTVQATVGRLEDDAFVVIVDEGCGIGSGDLPHIFERFYRADPARARVTGGTGLGLAIADQIVRSHGGRIEVTSAIDQGSTFAVFLPLAVVAAPSTRAPHMVNAG